MSWDFEGFPSISINCQLDFEGVNGFRRVMCSTKDLEGLSLSLDYEDNEVPTEILRKSLSSHCPSKFHETPVKFLCTVADVSLLLLPVR